MGSKGSTNSQGRERGRRRTIRRRPKSLFLRPHRPPASCDNHIEPSSNVRPCLPATFALLHSYRGAPPPASCLFPLLVILWVTGATDLEYPSPTRFNLPLGRFRVTEGRVWGPQEVGRKRSRGACKGLIFYFIFMHTFLCHFHCRGRAKG